MDKNSLGRRVFLKKMTALSAAGVPVVAGLASRSAHAAYDPAAKFELKVSEVKDPHTGQPHGFKAILDIDEKRAAHKHAA